MEFDQIKLWNHVYCHGLSHPVEIGFVAVQEWMAATWNGLGTTFSSYRESVQWGKKCLVLLHIEISKRVVLWVNAEQMSHLGPGERQSNSGKASCFIELQGSASADLNGLLVNGRHNESAVPPTEFLLSTPAVVILKWVESPFLLLCMSALFQSSVKSVCPLSSFHFTIPCLSLLSHSLVFVFTISSF